MAYRPPGVTVTQNFLAAAPALAAIALPNCIIGPAFQIVDNDTLGSYSGLEQVYAYASLAPAAIVDLGPNPLPPVELFPATKKKIEVNLLNTVLGILDNQSTGAVAGTTFTDATPNIFENVVAGDLVNIVAQTAVTVVAARTDGVGFDAIGQTNRLASGVAGQFANVKVGDSVLITGGTNIVTPPVTRTVAIKVSDSLLVLSGDVSDGVTPPPTNVAYSIVGNRGVTGVSKVKAVIDLNTLQLVSPLTTEAPLTYNITRVLAGAVSVPRVATVSVGGFYANANGITMPDFYEVTVGAVSFMVLSATVSANYRALRTDLSSEVKEYADIAAMEAVFGVGQIQTNNDLPKALSIGKANTASSVFGLALGAAYFQDELTAYLQALDVLSMEDTYALCPLTFNPAVHSAFKNHVEQLSLPANKLERAVIISSKLETIGLVQDEATTSVSLIGARNIVTTKTTGYGSSYGFPSTLNDATPDVFMDVEPGDSVTVVSSTVGTVNLGTYTVLSKASSNQIVLSATFLVSTTVTGITYFIQRKDGLASDGIKFYDRNAAFLTNGAAVGHFLEIKAGPFAGRFMIGAISDDKNLELASTLAGVTTLLTGVDYVINRDLSKTEQAENIAGYSRAFSSRRVCHTWSDVGQAPQGSAIVDLPGYMMSTTVAALTTGLPTQQGFTNLSIAGFIGIKHSTKYFTEAQLNTIADGGTMIFIQEGPSQPLVIRHQLTTDRSSIKFQEYSITKNVDFAAKFIRNAYKPFMGKYNIVGTTMDLLRTTGQACISFLKDKTQQPFIGGVIVGGTLASLTEDPTQIDTVNAAFNLTIPVPLNQLDIVLNV